MRSYSTYVAGNDEDLFISPDLSIQDARESAKSLNDLDTRTCENFLEPFEQDLLSRPNCRRLEVDKADKNAGAGSESNSKSPGSPPLLERRMPSQGDVTSGSGFLEAACLAFESDRMEEGQLDTILQDCNFLW